MAREIATVTLRDVARLAGVSVSTASKALNGRTDVNAGTRARVEEAARTLSFTPNHYARRLSSPRSGTIGLLTSDLEGRFSLPILMGAEDAFGAGELSVILCDARGDTIREQRHLQTLLSHRVDGIMVVGSYTDPREPVSLDLPVPVVYVYAPSASADDLSIVPDNVMGGRLAIEHLLDAGYRRIAHITGMPHEQACLDRANGIDAALVEAGLSVVYRTPHGEWTERWGRSATGMLLGSEADVDAIICDSDQIARGAFDALRELGKSVPGDVALMGFDNWSIISGSTNPGITSIDMNLEQLGRTAAHHLFSAMQVSGPREFDIRGVQKQSCSIVIRGSTIPDL